MSRSIYLDHAAATPVLPQALSAYQEAALRCCGNPSSLHQAGRDAHNLLEEARCRIAHVLTCLPEEVFFTSGGTEGDNWAIRGLLKARNGAHLIVSAIEHPAVLSLCRCLQTEGYQVTYIQPDSEGWINPEQVERAVQSDTALISVMTANNETGVIQPSADIGRIASAHGIPFHTDAVQAPGAIPLFPDVLRCDLMTLSAHKFRGVRGVGIQYIRRGTRCMPLILGGHQEHGRRASTENVAGACAAAEALEYAVRHMEEHNQKTETLRNKLENGLAQQMGHMRINGKNALRLPGILNATFPGADNQAVMIRLDLEGICVSTGSACTAGIPDPSHVLLAMGRSELEVRSSLRFSLSYLNTEQEIDRAIAILPGIIHDVCIHK